MSAIESRKKPISASTAGASPVPAAKQRSPQLFRHEDASRRTVRARHERTTGAIASAVAVSNPTDAASEMVLTPNRSRLSGTLSAGSRAPRLPAPLAKSVVGELASAAALPDVPPLPNDDVLPVVPAKRQFPITVTDLKSKLQNHHNLVEELQKRPEWRDRSAKDAVSEWITLGGEYRVGNVCYTIACAISNALNPGIPPITLRDGLGHGMMYTDVLKSHGADAFEDYRIVPVSARRPTHKPGDILVAGWLGYHTGVLVALETLPDGRIDQDTTIIAHALAKGNNAYDGTGSVQLVTFTQFRRAVLAIGVAERVRRPIQVDDYVWLQRSRPPVPAAPAATPPTTKNPAHALPLDQPVLRKPRQIWRG